MIANPTRVKWIAVSLNANAIPLLEEERLCDEVAPSSVKNNYASIRIFADPAYASLQRSAKHTLIIHFDFDFYLV